jgi:hypothetical protein
MDVMLDGLCAAGRVRGEAIVAATHYIPGNQNGVLRVTRLIAEGRAEPRFVERQLLGGGWMKSLTGDQLHELLSAIAGRNLEYAAFVIDFLAMWVHSGKPIEGALRELAWRCFESAPQEGEAWDYDLVASALAPEDLPRAFALFELLLTLPSDRKSWEPLDRHGGNRFWNTLW